MDINQLLASGALQQGGGTTVSGGMVQGGSVVIQGGAGGFDMFQAFDQQYPDVASQQVERNMAFTAKINANPELVVGEQMLQDFNSGDIRAQIQEQPRYLIYRYNGPGSGGQSKSLVALVGQSPDAALQAKYDSNLQKLADRAKISKTWRVPDINQLTGENLASQLGVPGTVDFQTGGFAAPDFFQAFDQQYAGIANQQVERNMAFTAKINPNPELIVGENVLQDFNSDGIRSKITEQPRYLMYRYNGPGSNGQSKSLVALVGKSSDPALQKKYEDNLPKLAEHVKIPKTWQCPDVNQLTGENLASQLGVPGTVDYVPSIQIDTRPTQQVPYPQFTYSPAIDTANQQFKTAPIKNNYAVVYKYEPGKGLVPETTLQDFNPQQLQSALPHNEPRYISTRYVSPTGGPDKTLLTYYNPPDSDPKLQEYYTSDGPKLTQYLNIPSVWQIRSPLLIDDNQFRTQGISPSDGFKPIPPSNIPLPPPGRLPDNISPSITSFLQQPVGNGGGYILKYDPGTRQLVPEKTLPDGNPQTLQQQIPPGEPRIIVWRQKDPVTGNISEPQLTYISGNDPEKAKPYMEYYPSLQQGIPNAHPQTITNPSQITYPSTGKSYPPTSPSTLTTPTIHPATPQLPPEGTVPDNLKGVITPYQQPQPSSPNGGGTVLKYDPGTGQLVPERTLPNGDPKTVQNYVPDNEPRIVVWQPKDPVTGEVGPTQLNFISGTDPEKSKPYKTWYNSLKKSLPNANPQIQTFPTQLQFFKGQYPKTDEPDAPPLPQDIKGKIQSFINEATGGDKSDALVLTVDPNTGNIQHYKTVQDVPPGQLQNYLPPNQPSFVVYRPDDPTTGDERPPKLYFVTGGKDPKEQAPYNKWIPELHRNTHLPFEQANTPADVEKYNPQKIAQLPTEIPKDIDSSIQKYVNNPLSSGPLLLKVDPSGQKLIPYPQPPNAPLDSFVPKTEPSFVLYSPKDPATGEQQDPHLLFFSDGASPNTLGRFHPWFGLLQKKWPIPTQKIKYPSEFKPEPLTPEKVTGAVESKVNEFLNDPSITNDSVINFTLDPLGKLVHHNTDKSVPSGQLKSDLPTGTPSFSIYRPKDPTTGKFLPPHLIYNKNGACDPNVLRRYNMLLPLLQKKWNLPTQTVSHISEFKLPVLDAPKAIPPSTLQSVNDFLKNPATQGDSALIFKLTPGTNTLNLDKTLNPVTVSQLPQFIPSDSPALIVYNPKKTPGLEAPPTQLILVTNGWDPKRLQIFQQWLILFQSTWVFSSQTLDSILKFKLPPYSKKDLVGDIDGQYKLLFGLQTPWAAILKVQPNGEIITERTIPEITENELPGVLPADEPRIVILKPKSASIPHVIFWNIGSQPNLSVRYQAFLPLLSEKWGLPSVTVNSPTEFGALKFPIACGVAPKPMSGFPSFSGSVFTPAAKAQYDLFAQKPVNGAAVLILKLDKGSNSLTVENYYADIQLPQLQALLPQGPRFVIIRAKNQQTGAMAPTKIVFSALGQDLLLIAQYQNLFLMLQAELRIFWSMRINFLSEFQLLLNFIIYIIQIVNTIILEPMILVRWKALNASTSQFYSIILKYDAGRNCLVVDYNLPNKGLKDVKTMLPHNEPRFVIFRILDKHRDPHISIIYTALEGISPLLLQKYDEFLVALQMQLNLHKVLRITTLEQFNEKDFFGWLKLPFGLFKGILDFGTGIFGTGLDIFSNVIKAGTDLVTGTVKAGADLVTGTVKAGADAVTSVSAGIGGAFGGHGHHGGFGDFGAHQDPGHRHGFF